MGKMKRLIKNTIVRIIAVMLAVSLVAPSITIRAFAAEEQNEFYYVNFYRLSDECTRTLIVFHANDSIYVAGEDVQFLSGYVWDKDSVFNFISLDGTETKKFKSADVYDTEGTTWFNLEKLAGLLELCVASDNERIIVFEREQAVKQLLDLCDTRGKYSLENIRYESDTMKAVKAIDIITSLDNTISYVSGSYDYDMYYELVGEIVKPDSELIADLQGMNKSMAGFKLYSKIRDTVKKDSKGLLYLLLVGDEYESYDNTYETMKLLSKSISNTTDLVESYAAACWMDNIVNAGFTGVEKIYDSGMESGVLTNRDCKRAVQTILDIYNGDGFDDSGFAKTSIKSICEYVISDKGRKLLSERAQGIEYIGASELGLDMANIGLGFIKQKIKKQLQSDVSATLKYKYYYDIQYQADNAVRRYRQKKDYQSLKYSLYVYYRCAELANEEFVGRKGFNQYAIDVVIDSINQCEVGILDIPDIELANANGEYYIDFDNLEKRKANRENIKNYLTDEGILVENLPSPDTDIIDSETPVPVEPKVTKPDSSRREIYEEYYNNTLINEFGIKKTYYYDLTHDGYENLVVVAETLNTEDTGYGAINFDAYDFVYTVRVFDVDASGTVYEIYYGDTYYWSPIRLIKCGIYHINGADYLCEVRGRLAGAPSVGFYECNVFYLEAGNTSHIQGDDSLYNKDGYIVYNSYHFETEDYDEVIGDGESSGYNDLINEDKFDTYLENEDRVWNSVGVVLVNTEGTNGVVEW